MSVRWQPASVWLIILSMVTAHILEQLWWDGLCLR